MTSCKTAGMSVCAGGNAVLCLFCTSNFYRHKNNQSDAMMMGPINCGAGTRGEETGRYSHLVAQLAIQQMRCANHTQAVASTQPSSSWPKTCSVCARSCLNRASAAAGLVRAEVT